MATLSGMILRLTAVVILAVALATLYPKVARAQSADSADQSASDNQGSDNGAPDTGGEAGDTGEKSAPPAAAASTDSGSTDSGAAARSDSSSKPGSSVKSDSPPSDQYASHVALKTFETPPPSGDPKFDNAALAFPDFCRDWQRKLHDRELNNLENISWKDQNGWKTATYVSYSPVKTCNCKRSTGGVPIGELTYQETELYLAGRTVEEARHASPKPVGITNTTEIFRWNKSKWDDGQ
ncbi:MAG TPA: hypothetical protein VGH29_09520 [Candidatus Binataceae bacterium]